MYSVNLPPAPATSNYAQWLAGGAHINVDTKKGMTLGGGVYPSLGPLTMIERKTGVSIKDFVTYPLFTDSVQNELELRGLRHAESQDPDFDPLAFNGSGRNAWSPMHDVWGALLDDLHAHGEQWAWKDLEAVVTSWWVNAKWGKYLIDGGNPSLPYQDAGRLRTAASVLSVLFHLSRCYEREAKRGNSGVHSRLAFTSGLLKSHLDRIVKHLPLVAKPQGDHLPVPHVETFMAGLLHQVAKKIRGAGFEVGLCEQIMDMMRRIVATADLSKCGFPDGTFAYDVAVREDGEFYIYDSTIEPLTGDAVKDKIILGRRPSGIGGVNSWVERLATSFALHEDAVKLGWEKKQPMLWLTFCEEFAS